MKFFDNFFATFQAAPKMMAVKAEEEEEELVDPQETLRIKYRESDDCKKHLVKLETCNERVGSRSKTAETCWEEVLDLYHCVDHHVAHHLFQKLK